MFREVEQVEPTLQQKLLHYVDEHCASYIDAWSHLYTQLYTLNRQKIQGVVTTQLQHPGMSIHLLDKDPLLIYAEMATGAPETLRH